MVEVMLENTTCNFFIHGRTIWNSILKQHADYVFTPILYPLSPYSSSFISSLNFCLCSSFLLMLHLSFPLPRCISHPLLHFPVWWRSPSFLPGGCPWSVHLRGWHHMLGEALPHLYWYVNPHWTTIWASFAESNVLNWGLYSQET